jgi:plastocyanin
LSAKVSAYEVITVKNGGTIAGEITFTGTPPAPEKVTVTKDEDVCGKTEKFDESVLIGTNRGIQNVVVMITPIEQGKDFSEGPVTLDQKDCRYEPHIVLLPAGKELTILNSDGILHTVHSYSTANPVFNKVQSKFKKELKESFTFPERVKLMCDTHGWMRGWVVVQEHPYYAVSDVDGTFRLTDIPPGKYTVHLWHESLGEVTRDVSLHIGEEVKIDISWGK